MSRDTWRTQFSEFAQSMAGKNVYVTIDLDCLREEDAATNWENGLFTAHDLAWALELLHSRSKVLGGDLCGAWSQPMYQRRFQAFAGGWDHPKQFSAMPADGLARNRRSLEVIWPALLGPAGGAIEDTSRLPSR